MKLEKIQCRLLCLLNSDVEVTPGWFEPMIDLLEYDKLYMQPASPKSLHYNNKNVFEYAGAAGGWLDNMVILLPEEGYLIFVKKTKVSMTNTDRSFWASGAALVIRAKCFMK